MRRVELRAALALGTAERLHRVGVLPAPASDLAYVVCTRGWCPSRRCAQAGWAPAYDNETCARGPAGRHPRAPRRGRPAGRPQGRGARRGQCGGGARGTAAIMRRRRRKRRRSMNQQTGDGSTRGEVVLARRPRRARCPSTRSSRPCATRAPAGIALFVGVVREHDHGEAVTALDYSAHPTAPDVLRAGGRGGRRPPRRHRARGGAPRRATSRSATSRSSSAVSAAAPGEALRRPAAT